MERKSITFRRKNVKMVVAKSMYLFPIIATIALQRIHYVQATKSIFCLL